MMENRLTFSFTYITGTDPQVINYIKTLFYQYSPVPVAFPDDLSSVIRNGFLAGTINYSELKPLTAEFIYFIAALDSVTGQSNIYNFIWALIVWLQQFVPDTTPDVVPADFGGVVWLHTNVSGWAQTGVLSSVTLTDSTITLNYNKANVWPQLSSSQDVNANPWIFVNLDGVWYAATWEWLKTGQTVKAITSVSGSHIKMPPLDTFMPVSGVSYGFMVSGLARDSSRNVYERTNLLMVTWP
ncbi:MAG: hypothetical protein WA151_10100 [Desulfatirhabdiaceae bacterium]